MTDANASAEPRLAISVPVYALAHFGKSLWWNGSELLLAFYLTEQLKLQGLTAGFAIAAGLILGAIMDIVVAERRRWFASIPRAGRMQCLGACGSLAALGILCTAADASESARLLTVVGANLVYRLAYVFYDLPQNCLLGLIEWTGEQRRRAASMRTATSAIALVIISFASGVIGCSPIWGIGAVTATAGIALVSAGWLWRATRKLPDVVRSRRSADYRAIGLPLAMMAVVCLTLPAFSKLAPYLAAYAPAVASAPLLLVVIGCSSAVSQPAWLMLIRHCGETYALRVAGVFVVCGSAIASAGTMTVAGVLIGAASGGLGTGIWSMFAASLAAANPLDVAPAFARLTATAKIALAAAAIGIGALLGSTDYRGDGTRLLPAITLLTLVGGIAVIALSCSSFVIRRETRVGSA